MTRKNTNQLLHELMDTNDLHRVLTENDASFREDGLTDALQRLFEHPPTQTGQAGRPARHIGQRRQRGAWIAGLVRKAGAWFTYGTDQLGQGKENARSFLRNNPDVAEELEKRIRLHLGVDKEDVPEGVNPETGEVDF